jgi:hypothetical protein
MTVALRAFEGTPPRFLLRGLRLTSDGGRVYTKDHLLALKAANLAQDGGQVPLAGPPIPSEAEKPALEAPSPALAAADPEREAAFAELARILVLNAEAAAENERLAKVLADARGARGLALAAQLKRLRQRHNIHANPPPLPLGPPVGTRVLRIRAIAATADTDLERSRFLPTCWPKLDPTKIRLLISHDPDRVAGAVDAIEVDALGCVFVICTLTSRTAMRMPAMSISARIGGFTIRDPDLPSFVGEISAVTDVNEISLTPNPFNRRCVVLERWEPSAADLRHQEMLDRIQRMREMVLQMRAA